MDWRNHPDRWGTPSIALHWLTVLLIVAMAVLGLSMTELPTSMTKLRLYALHKSLGLSVLALTALRLGWRLYAGAPAAIAGTPRWQLRAAHLSHALLYLLLLAIPLSGWAYNSAANFALQWFGLFNLPKLVPADPGLKIVLREVHEALFWTLAAIVLVHAGAALWHHYRQRDLTLARMLPGLKSRGAKLPGVEPPTDQEPA